MVQQATALSLERGLQGPIRAAESPERSEGEADQSGGVLSHSARMLKSTCLFDKLRRLLKHEAAASRLAAADHKGSAEACQ